MDKLEFKKLMFRTAFCCMACDGQIDQSEIDEMKKMDENSFYFGDMDLSAELKRLINDLKTKKKGLLEELFQELRDTKLNPIQELLLLEVTMRIMHADKKVDENEVRFLKLLRGRLDLHNETIKDRFGAVDYLFDKDYSKDIEVAEKNFFEGVDFKEFNDLTSFVLSKKDKP